MPSSRPHARTSAPSAVSDLICTADAALPPADTSAVHPSSSPASSMTPSAGSYKRPPARSVPSSPASSSTPSASSYERPPVKARRSYDHLCLQPMARRPERSDLPGFTRSVYKKDHALITPESHVFSPLPDWTNTLGAYLISPALGAHFTMYLANMQDGSKSALPPKDVERLIFVVQGSIALSVESGTTHSLLVDSYAYLPANMKHSVISDKPTTLVIFERRYTTIGDYHPDLVVGSTDKQPLLETPGEVFELRKLLPTSLPYDFNIHIMDFQPGEYLNVKEVHYNQHGLLLLEGQGIYRLGNSWYPVQAGDTIWMAPFVPQWYAALGKTKSRYLLYKDVNRNPLI